MWIWYFFIVFMANELQEWREKCFVMMGAFAQFPNRLQIELVRLKNIVFSDYAFIVYGMVLVICVFFQNSISKSLIMSCLAFLSLNSLVIWFLYHMYLENSILYAIILFIMLPCYIYIGVHTMETGEYKATIYDDVWRTIVHDFPNLLIAFVNELFSESYSRDARVEFLQDTHEQKMPDGSVEKRITDTYFRIIDRYS